MGKRSGSVVVGSSNRGVDGTDLFNVENESPLRSGYSSLTVVKLRQELKRRGLSQKGIKRELVCPLCAIVTVIFVVSFTLHLKKLCPDDIRNEFWPLQAILMILLSLLFFTQNYCAQKMNVQRSVKNLDVSVHTLKSLTPVWCIYLLWLLLLLLLVLVSFY